LLRKQRKTLGGYFFAAPCIETKQVLDIRTSVGKFVQDSRHNELCWQLDVPEHKQNKRYK